VLPGREVEVARRIEKQCAESGIKAEHIRLFRLFGAYDLALIQDDCSLTKSDLAGIGSIEGLTGSTEHVCYSWLRDADKSVESFEIDRISQPLLGLCFLKVNPLLTQRHGLEAEIEAAAHVATYDSSVQVLGTLGWTEMILLISDSSLLKILERIKSYFTKLRIVSQAGETIEAFSEKTLTMIGHVLAISDPTAPERPQVALEPALLKRRALEVHFSASCTPSAMEEIQAYAVTNFKLAKREPRITFRLGARDLDFEVPLRGVKTLNALIERLDQFRAKNTSALIRTHTELQYRISKTEWVRWPLRARKTLMLRLSRMEASKLLKLGAEGASVATTIYHFDNLIENRLLVDAFSDMARAMSRLKETALKLVGPLSVNARWGLATRLQHIQQAVSQRYQGVYVGVEESPWGVSFGIQPAGIGIQRVLKAVELYSLGLLLRLNKKWSGFALIGRHARPAMEHFEDILLLPAGEALDARRHWAISHETMHMLQHLEPARFSLEALAEATRRPVPIEDRPAKLLIETTADIMEFRLSCTLSCKDYLRVVWRYLNEGLFEQSSQDQLTSYFMRSFAVYYSEATAGASDILAEKQIQNLFDEFAAVLQEYSIELERLRTPDERGQIPSDLLLQEFKLDILPYLKCINDRVAEVQHTIRQSITIDVESCLQRLARGQILDSGEMEHADVIAWALARQSLDGKHQSEADASRLSIAWILSLWHAYHIQRRGPDLEAIEVAEMAEPLP
jgi:hypothetical protein